MQTEQIASIADRYRLGTLAGAHGPVCVYLAQDAQLDRPVMVQMISHDESGGSPSPTVFLDHQQLASSIHHCSVLAVYDAGEWQGKPFSVMELDKGEKPEALHRAGYPPDNALVLQALRETAEALQCVRDAGLGDWAFAPGAVRIDDEGHAHLALYEGLESEAASSSASQTDGRALGALLGVMLAGKEIASEHELTAAPVPPSLVGLYSRLVSSASESTAAEVIRAVSTLEAASLTVTEAYDPERPSSSALVAANNGDATLNLAEAPTLPAPAVPYEPENSAKEVLSQTYAPVLAASATEPDVPGSTPQRDRRRLLLPMLAGIFLLVALAALAARSSFGSFGGALAAAAPSTVGAAAAPDLLGKDTNTARALAGDAGLNLSIGDPVRDIAIPENLVAQQDPPSGTIIKAGSLITVSLSLGPEPVATAAPTPHVNAPAAPQQKPQQAAPPPEGDKKGGPPPKNKDKGGKKENDH